MPPLQDLDAPGSCPASCLTTRTSAPPPPCGLYHILSSAIFVVLGSYLLRGALLPVGGRGGCYVADGGRRVGAVTAGRGAGLRGDGGGRHVAHQARASLHPDVRVALGRHVEDGQTVVVEPRELTLEHTCASLAPAHAHRRLAVEDSQLTTCAHTHTHTAAATHMRPDTQKREFERYPTPDPGATVRGWDRISMAERTEAVDKSGAKRRKRRKSTAHC